MHIHDLVALASILSAASARISYTLERASNPNSDQQSAYQKITSAMDLAMSRYNRGAPNLSGNIRVSYAPGEANTADASGNHIRFGSNRAFMNERTALHETMHALGVGGTGTWKQKCDAKNFPNANRVLKSFDGQGASLGCDRQHYWPYGLNYDSEFSQEKADRHVKITAALVSDGIGGAGGGGAGGGGGASGARAQAQGAGNHGGGVSGQGRTSGRTSGGRHGTG